MQIDAGLLRSPVFIITGRMAIPTVRAKFFLLVTTVLKALYVQLCRHLSLLWFALVLCA